jgi:hypothetical protein
LSIKISRGFGLLLHRGKSLLVEQGTQPHHPGGIFHGIDAQLAYFAGAVPRNARVRLINLRDIDAIVLSAQGRALWELAAGAAGLRHITRVT